MTIPLFTPALVNNTNPVDFLIYTYESANPGTTVASAFWGSISQAFMFGVIVVSVSLLLVYIGVCRAANREKRGASLANAEDERYEQASKYYWQYIGADGWINVTIVSILVAVTTSVFPLLRP